MGQSALVMRSPTLYAVHYSPWSRRALWSLEHHKISFRYREHTPMLGELLLRGVARRGKHRGTVSVPMLVLSDAVLTDSLEIMRYADAHGSAPSLRTDQPEVAQWFERLEPAYDAGRRRVTQRVLQRPAALQEAAAASVPAFLAGPARPVAAMGARFIAKKYGFDAAGDTPPDALITGLDAVQHALSDGYLVGDRLSAADIAAACLLGAIRPHPSVGLGPALTSAWTEPDLEQRYGDLLAWRDALIATHISACAIH